MKPLLLLNRVDGPQESTIEKATLRARALASFCKRLRQTGQDTVGQVEYAMECGVTREQIAEDLGLHLRDMPAWEQRALFRWRAKQAEARVRKVFVAE